MDIETASEILTESHTHLAKTKSHSLTHTLIFKALQAGKCWDEIKGILQLKHCDANIHTKHDTLWTYNRRIMKLLLPMSTTSQQQLSNVPLTMTLWPSAFLLKEFGMHTSPQVRKIYKKDPQTLSEVIRIVEKSNPAQQLTPKLVPSTVSMFVDEWIILAITAHMHSVTAAMNSATLHRIAPTRFLCQVHHATETGLIQGNDTPMPEGTDHAPPTMGTDR